MELIDRNKIMYTDISDGQVPSGVWISFRDRINKMPTIDAIPVEWVMNYINSIGGSNGVTKLHKEILKTMLKDWKKENK